MARGCTYRYGASRCEETFWAPNASEGYNCIPCPTGGSCPGRESLPYAQPNYWTPLYNVSRAPTDATVHDVIFIECTAFSQDGFCAGGHEKSFSALCSEGYEGAAW